MRTSARLLMGACVVVLGLPGMATPLTSYEFTGGTLSPTTTAAGFSSSSISSTGFSTSFTTDWIYARGDQTAAGGSATEATAIANDDFFEFTLTPDSGTYSLGSLTYDTAFYERDGSNNSPYDSFSFVRSSVDGYGANLAFFNESGQTLPSASDPPTFTPRSVDLTGAAFQNLSGAVTFRIYVYDDINGSTRLSAIDNLTVNAAIPEPSSLLLMSGGLMVMLQIFRRNRA